MPFVSSLHHIHITLFSTTPTSGLHTTSHYFNRASTHTLSSSSLCFSSCQHHHSLASQTPTHNFTLAVSQFIVYLLPSFFSILPSSFSCSFLFSLPICYLPQYFLQAYDVSPFPSYLPSSLYCPYFAFHLFLFPVLSDNLSTMQ